jgi:hypothetical protein
MENIKKIDLKTPHSFVYKIMIYLIYKIHCNITDEDYYGSTTDLYHRMSAHKCDTEKQNSKRCCKAKIIIDRGNYSVDVIETLEVETKQDALWRERYYIENFPCVNEGIPIKTADEVKERKKKYQIDNKKYLAEKKAEYRKSHAKELAEKEMARYKANRDNINQKRREEKIMCEACGILINKAHKVRHEKTKQHQDCLATGNKYVKPEKTYEEIKYEKTICECGGKYSHTHKTTHAKTKRHQDYLSNLIDH